MKYFKDWKRITLDTTVICSLFRSENSEVKNSQDQFVRRLITYLTGHKTSSNEPRTLLVSAITISELITNEENTDKIKRIMRVLNSKNVELIDFDLEVALAFNYHLKQKLDRSYLHQKALEIGFKTNDFAMAREWITRDYMIALCGSENNSDILLTADKKSYPIFKDLPNVNCVLAYEELFDCSEQHILGYKENEVASFLMPPSPIAMAPATPKAKKSSKAKNKEEIKETAEPKGSPKIS